MKIKYTGKARAKVEGIGYFEPGEERLVPEAVGKELCRGKEFREVVETWAPATGPVETSSAPAEETNPPARRSRKKKSE